MGQTFKIVRAWKNYISGKISNLERLRAKSCTTCDHAVVGTYEKLMPDFQLKEIQGLKCGKCNCPLSTKLRSETDKCPLGKW
ncbi:hypothetical protein [Aquimarina intermedia]|uniref:Uncharacterized protein n=1 Tax=Aquimarina intermedia TaxID=350814 RepID=A0A5S5BYR1_9FLAO|nr:hypothetical protein [Aquimarina intermedia]TYP71488.1 hypothetical protein BD809_10970 [Aquimarina intermedia]